MLRLVCWLGLALPMAAQEGQAPPQAEQAPAQAQPEQAPPPAQAPAQAPEPQLEAKPVIRVRLNPDAKSWEPVSVRVAGDPSKQGTRFSRLVKKTRQGLRGQSSKARAVARLHPFKGDKMLVVSVFPEALKPWKRHMEVRFLVVEGFLEGAQVAAVMVKDPAFRPGPEQLDSFQLKRLGVAFLEEFAASGALTVSALDPRPGRSSLNAASLAPSEFGDPDLGFVTLSYSVKGVSPEGR